MSSPEELAIEADLNSDAAKVLEEEAFKLEKQGLLIGARGKMQEARFLQAKAKGLLQERMLVLQQQRSGACACMRSLVQCVRKNEMELLLESEVFLKLRQSCM